MSIKYIAVDVEADGPIPGDYSMVWFGAVIVEPGLARTFEGKLQPISKYYREDALKISGLTREETEKFEKPLVVMNLFFRWIKENLKPDERPIFISDNNGFDWMFICWYFYHFMGENPFGHSSANINWLYKGIVKNFYKSFKFMREKPHDHNPVNDAKGNAEAFIKIAALANIKI